METVNVELKVPKESKEVVDAVMSIVLDIKAGKSIAEISASNLPKAVNAIQGYEKLGEEGKSEQRHDLYGYAGYSISKALA